MIVTSATTSATELLPSGDLNRHLGWAPSTQVPARVVVAAYDRVCGPGSIFGHCFRRWDIEAVAYQWPFDNVFRLHTPVQTATVTFRVGTDDHEVAVRGEVGEAWLACPDGYEAGEPITVEYTSGEEVSGTPYVAPAEVQTAVLMAAEALILDPANPRHSERALAFTLRRWNRQGWL